MTPFRQALRPMLRLALPLVLAELGWMFMGLADTVMVGHMPDPAVPLSSAALAQILYNTLAFGFGGVLLGLDALISQAHGAKDLKQANRWLIQSVLLAVALACLLMLIYLLLPFAMAHMPVEAAVLAQAGPALRALSWGTIPLLLYFSLRRYLQAFNHARLVAACLVTANLINVLFDWLLIFPHRLRLGSLSLGSGGFGVVGSGIATSLARLYMAAFCVAAILYVDRRHGYGLLQQARQSLRPDWSSLRRMLALGLPSGATILVEIAIFAVVTSVIATLGPVPLAGHEIALNCISFTFMIPLGISAAASVRVGQAIGRGALPEAKAAGWAAIALGCLAMGCSSALYVVAPHWLAMAFTPSASVIAAAVPLMRIAAIFQFCDGLQVTAIGALRGAGDTRSGLFTHLCSYWLLGLPLGLFLCFHAGLGARGLWLGLCTSLTISGLVLLFLWTNKILQLKTPASETQNSRFKDLTA